MEKNGKKLAHEIAVVTGSDSGIGQATAIEFAKEGANVAVTYFQDKNGAEKTLKALEQHGVKAIMVKLDVRNPDEVEKLFDAVEEQLGTPTILVNNAGIGTENIPVKDLPIEEWDNRIKTNLYGPFFCCQQFIRRLEGKNKHGSIINVTSVHQEIPSKGAAGYDASKGGLRNLTTTLALEVADKNINVNNLAPGMVLTPMNQEDLDDLETYQKDIQPIPLKRAAEPWEIARAAVYLASEDARYVHGTTLTIDGGLEVFHGE